MGGSGRKFFDFKNTVILSLIVISALALIFQIRFLKRRGILNVVVFLNHLQFHGVYLKVIKLFILN